jgi:uncharacterized Zn finger protein (UPF0148 family)
MTDEKRYICKKCGFKWFQDGKEYEKCPICDSEDISLIAVNESLRPAGQQSTGGRGGYGGGTKCPECGVPLCGAD